MATVYGIWRRRRHADPPRGNRPRLASQTPKTHPRRRCGCRSPERSRSRRDRAALDGGDHRLRAPVVAQQRLPVQVRCLGHPLLDVLLGVALTVAEVHAGREAPPAPVRIAAADVVVAVDVGVRRRPTSIVGLSAFFASARFIVTMAVTPSRSNVRCSVVITVPSRGRRRKVDAAGAGETDEKWMVKDEGGRRLQPLDNGAGRQRTTAAHSTRARRSCRCARARAGSS